MINKRINKVLTYLIVMTFFLFGLSSSIYGQESNNKKDMDLMKLKENEIPFSSSQYEEMKQILLNDENSLYDSNLSNRISNKAINMDNGFATFSNDYTTYYEFEPNDSKYS